MSEHWWNVIFSGMQSLVVPSKHKPYTRNRKGQIAKRRAQRKAAKKVRISLRRKGR